MPKKGPTTSEWKNWLRQYAQGEFIFQRGKKPQKGSVWAGVLQTIDSCQRHRNPNILNALGNPIECSCGYHDVCCKVQLMSEVYECSTQTPSPSPSTSSSTSQQPLQTSSQSMQQSSPSAQPTTVRNNYF